MRVSYDEKTDTLSRDSARQHSGCRKRRGQAGHHPGLRCDGQFVSLEILDASKRVTETRKIEFQTTG